jgi:hypothetical protein
VIDGDRLAAAGVHWLAAEFEPGEGGGEGDGLADGGGAVVAASVTMVWALTVTFTPLLVAFVTVLPPAYVARK